MKFPWGLLGRSGSERSSGIATADRKALAKFLLHVRKRGGAVTTDEVLKKTDPTWCQAAERAFHEALVRGHRGRGARESAAFAQWAELHLTTTGEKLAKDWSRRWWRRLLFWLGIPIVALESLASLLMQLLELVRIASPFGG